MLTLSDARFLLAGLLLGAAVAALVPLGSPRAAASPVPRRERPPPENAADEGGDCDVRAQQRDRALSGAWAQLQEAEQRLQSMKGGIEALIGPEPAFSDLSARFQPERVEDTVLASLNTPEIARGTELEWIDCSEAPCIAILRLSPEVWEGGPGEVSELNNALREALGTVHPGEPFGVAAGAFLTLPLGEASDPLLHQRLDLREEFLIRELSAAGRSEP